MSSNAERAELLTVALRAAAHSDRRTLADLYTEDVKAWTPTLSASSATELLAELDLRDDAFSEIDFEATPLDVGGNYACVEWAVSMTHTGSLELRNAATIEATRLRVTVNGVTVAEFRGDRICSLRQYWDEVSIFEQLGLLGDSS